MENLRMPWFRHWTVISLKIYNITYYMPFIYFVTHITNVPPGLTKLSLPSKSVNNRTVNGKSYWVI